MASNPQPNSPVSGFSTIPFVTGTAPGVLDSTQPARLLRLSNSKLSFASFDPRTATTVDASDIRNLSFQERSYRPKRIVIETTPTGECSWRFVPKACWQEGVRDEGKFPRVVDICGTLYECSQDQWDIYKLDPAYKCVMHASPNIPTISKVEPKTPVMPDLRGKRTPLTPSPERSPPSPNMKRKAPRLTHSLSESESEMEVEEIIVEDRPPRGERLKKVREQFEKNRQIRRERYNARFLQQQDEQDGMIFEPLPPSQPSSQPPTHPSKRKGPSFSRDPSVQEFPQQEEHKRGTHSHSHKRTRNVSPDSVRRELEEKRTERRQQKAGKWEQILDDRRNRRDKAFLDQILREIPDLVAEQFNNESVQQDPEDGHQQQENHTPMTDEEAERAARIAESRRKLAELEADRPLWEEEAKKRTVRENAEEEARRAQAEERRRAAVMQAEAEQRARAEQEAEELRQREKRLRQDREDFVRRERARRQQQRQRGYALGPWTTQRALEQYRMMCEIFDNTKFSEDDPLAIEDVPWPVLQSPAMFSVEDVDWTSVEKFFDAARLHMRDDNFKGFVQASHRRFHPDRWRARGLLKSVSDSTEKECLEVAANCVAQALTPLWSQLKGQ